MLKLFIGDYEVKLTDDDRFGKACKYFIRGKPNLDHCFGCVRHVTCFHECLEDNFKSV